MIFISRALCSILVISLQITANFISISDKKRRVFEKFKILKKNSKWHTSTQKPPILQNFDVIERTEVELGSNNPKFKTFYQFLTKYIFAVDYYK